MTRRRVVMTAVGMATPVGDTAQQSFEALLAGACGLGPDPTGAIDRQVGLVKADIAAQVHPAQARMMDRVTLLAQYVAGEVLRGAELDEAQQSQCGVFIGTGIGGVGTLCEAVEAYHGIVPKRPILAVPAIMANAAAALIAQNMRSLAEAQTYATACSAGAVAIGEAFRRIRDGYLDLALAGGAETM